MDDYTILPDITIIGLKNSIDFLMDLKDLVEDYDGYLDFDSDSDLTLEIADCEEDEPCGMTLEDYLYERE